MQNRTPIAAETLPPLPDFMPVLRKYRHDGWTPERGEVVPAVPLEDAASDGVAEVKTRPSRRQARKAKTGSSSPAPQASGGP